MTPFQSSVLEAYHFCAEYTKNNPFSGSRRKSGIFLIKKFALTCHPERNKQLSETTPCIEGSPCGSLFPFSLWQVSNRRNLSLQNPKYITVRSWRSLALAFSSPSFVRLARDDNVAETKNSPLVSQGRAHSLPQDRGRGTACGG